jgi:hypothetical protein
MQALILLANPGSAFGFASPMLLTTTIAVA